MRSAGQVPGVQPGDLKVIAQRGQGTRGNPVFIYPPPGKLQQLYSLRPAGVEKESAEVIKKVLRRPSHETQIGIVTEGDDARTAKPDITRKI